METIEFSALGTRLRLAPGDSPEEVQDLVRFVEERVEEVNKTAPNAQPVQIALLTALNIAEQLFKERQDEQAERQQAIGKVRLILESIE